MKWYTFLVYEGMDPVETQYRAKSEDEAFSKAREYWGPGPIIKSKTK